MIRMLVGATLAWGLITCAAQTARGDSALIETTAPLLDDSRDAVSTAVVSAIEKAVRGASAMGFAWVQLKDAQVLGREVVVQILATDDDPDDAAEAEPGPERSEGRGLTGERDLDRAPRGATPL